MIAVLAAVPALARANVDLKVCNWGFATPQPCTGDAWTNAHTSAAYREGDFVPYRIVFTPGGTPQIFPGNTYTLRFRYLISTSGLVNVDYLSTYNASQPHRGIPAGTPGPEIVPCSGVMGVPACDSNPQEPTSRTGVPQDTNTTLLNDNHPPSGAPDHVFSAWGVHLVSATQVTSNSLGCTGTTISPTSIPGGGPQYRCVDLTFTVPGNGNTAVGAVIAFSAHIATVADWGPGRTYALSGSGASFNVRLESLTTGTTSSTIGGQHISLNTIGRPTGFSTAVSPAEIHPRGTVQDVATLAGKDGAYPRGTVAFFVCPHTPTRTSCATGGTPAGRRLVVQRGTSITGDATLNFPNRAFQRPEGGLAPGFYCFRAVYRPGRLAPFLTDTHTDSATECFEVRQTMLAVDKVCVPEGDTGHFAVTVTGPNSFKETFDQVSCDDGTGLFEVPGPGTYRVTEIMPSPGNAHTYPTRTFGVGCNAQGEITVAFGESATCEITNARVPTANLTVNKVCTTTGLFNVVIHGADGREVASFPDIKCGTSTGPVALAPGKHTVTETPGTGTILGHYTTQFSDDCNAAGEVTLQLDHNKTCTITNRLRGSRITVDKVCAPAHDAGRFEITIDGAPHGTVACGHSIAIPVDPGMRTVAERGADGTNLAAYNRTIGGNCDAHGHVDVAPGENATCEISNVRHGEQHNVGELTLLKVCVPETDGGLFDLHIDGVTAHSQPCGGRVGPLVLEHGTYHVREGAGNRTDLSQYRTVFGGACGTGGSVRLHAGESKTCTITNIRHGAATAVLTVRKLCRPAHDNGHFTLNINDLSFAGMRCGQSTGPVTIATGTHLVGEAPEPDIASNYNTTIGGACASNGSIALTRGRHATCTVTNTRIRTVHPPRKPHHPRPHPPPPRVTG